METVLLTRFLSCFLPYESGWQLEENTVLKNIVCHSSRDGVPATQRPGYLVAVFLAAAALSPSGDANAGNVMRQCVAHQSRVVETAQAVADSQRAFHDAAIERGLARLRKTPLGALLADDANWNSVRINYVAASHISPDVSLSVPEANTVWIADNLPDVDLPAILGRELFIMQGFHQGTGAAASILDLASIYPGRGSFIEASVRESAAAWTVAAHLARELGHSPDPGAVSPVYQKAIDTYSRNLRSSGIADAMNVSLAEVRGFILGHASGTAAMETSWNLASNCGDHVQTGSRPAWMRADPSVRSLLQIMAKIERTPDISYPAETHQAFATVGGGVVVRQWDDSHGAYVAISNPIGPAIYDNGSEGYALNGRLMSREEWASTRGDVTEGALYAERPSAPSL